MYSHNEIAKSTLDLKVCSGWRNLDVQHIKEHVMIDRSGQRSYDVCVDRVDLVTGLFYTPGWLAPDGPSLTLQPQLVKFLSRAAKSQLLLKLNRAVVAYRAIVQIFDSFVPMIKKRNFLRLEESRAHLWCDLLELSLKDIMEKFLKEDFCHLMAYGTRKTSSRSGLAVFSGFIRKMLLTRAIRMSNSGSSGRKAAAFIRSMYESKRCWNEMSDELRVQSMEKHKQLLSSEKTISETAKNWIRRSVNIIIPPGTRYVENNCVPTWSASYETSRADGGNHSSVLKEGKSFELCETQNIERDFSRDLEYRLLSQADEEENDVKYQAIPEPGKFRVITIGREAIYSSLRAFQTFLISQWKRSSIGTMTDDLLDKILKLREVDGELYFSGDYDSATDALSMEATQVCIDQILENLSISNSYLARILRKSFSGATIHYPDGTVVKQTRGQLMGHPISFPLLCIINLSTYMRCMTITGARDSRLKKVLINGDDILFKGRPQDGRRWREAADDVGLIVNESKTYESPRWALINSVFVDMISGQKVNYVPLSMALGHNVKRGEITRTLGQAPAIWRLIELCPNERSRQMCQRIYLKTLDRLSPHLGSFVPNFFLHKDLGGYGITPSMGWRFGISECQRKVATFFMRNRAIRAIKEKIMELPKAVTAALEKLKKLRPPTFDWVLRGKPVEGPLKENQEVVDDYLERVLPLCLRSTCYVVGAGKTVDYELRHEYRQALKMKEKPCNQRKLKTYLPAREVCETISKRFVPNVLSSDEDIESSVPSEKEEDDSDSEFHCLWDLEL